MDEKAMEAKLDHLGKCLQPLILQIDELMAAGDVEGYNLLAVGVFNLFQKAQAFWEEHVSEPSVH